MEIECIIITIWLFQIWIIRFNVHIASRSTKVGIYHFVFPWSLHSLPSMLMITTFQNNAIHILLILGSFGVVYVALSLIQLIHQFFYILNCSCFLLHMIILSLQWLRSNATSAISIRHSQSFYAIQGDIWLEVICYYDFNKAFYILNL